MLKTQSDKLSTLQTNETKVLEPLGNKNVHALDGSGHSNDEH